MYLRRLIRETLAKRVREQWPQAVDIPIEVSQPPNPQLGDYATNLAMKLAPVVHDDPLRIAGALAGAFTKPKVIVAQPAPPGFVNLTLNLELLKRVPASILKYGQRYGHSDLGRGSRVHLEFISANPTGPLHLGNGRGAFIGDALGNLLSAVGYRVWREYYVNDQGKQVATLAESVIRKYFLLQGIPMEYPDYCYQGTYVEELAKRLKLDQAKADMEKLRKRVQKTVLNLMLRETQKLVEKRLGIRFDRWFRESTLSEGKLDERVLARLREGGVVYESEGATWMKTTAFGDDKDRVLVKSDQEKTYFLSDVAYVNDKFNLRRFDRAILLVGADHHGYVGRLKAAASALGQPGKLDVILLQLVRLLKGGQEVKMSKRAGTFVTLDELIDEVGPDVARFFFLMHGADTHMDFDLDLAKERSEKNPVFYVQYAHARIASLMKKVEQLLKKGSGGRRGMGEGGKRRKKVKVKSFRGNFGVQEAKLVKQLLRLPEVVEDTAQSYAVQQLPTYALRLARAFHEYYDTSRIIDNATINLTRLRVVQATQQVLKNTLALMGVSAPEKM